MNRKINNIIATLIWLVAFLLLIKQSGSLFGALIFTPISMFPHAINHFLVFKWMGAKTQTALLAGQLVFFGWFVYLYIDAFYFKTDPQSALILIFVGIYALPAMGLIWLWSFRCGTQHKKRER